MMIPPLLSHAFVDDLVGFVFCALPSIAEPELTLLLETVLYLANNEVVAAVRRERERCCAAIRAQLAHRH